MVPTAAAEVVPVADVAVVPAVAPVAAVVVSTLGPDTAAVIDGLVRPSTCPTRSTDLPTLGLEKSRQLSITPQRRRRTLKKPWA
jgi:hypothetical protein